MINCRVRKTLLNGNRPTRMTILPSIYQTKNNLSEQIHVPVLYIILIESNNYDYTLFCNVVKKRN